MTQQTQVWGSIFFFFLTYICAEIVIQGIYIILADIPLDGNLVFSEPEFLVTTVLSAIIASVVVYLFVKVNDTNPSIKVGLTANNKCRDFIIGTVIGGAVMASGFSILIMLGEISIESISINSLDLLCSLVVFLAVAYSEELIFRGFLMRKLQLRYNAKFALIASSIIFTIVHLGNDNLSIMGVFDLFVAGFMLGAFFLYTKNLWMAIGLHFGWNFFQTHLGFNVSGTDTYSIVEISMTQENLLNGGAFGFEGSFLSTLAQVIILVTLFVLYRDRLASNHRNVTSTL